MADREPNGSADAERAETTTEAAGNRTETGRPDRATVPLPTLKRLGDFELLRELGRGGMGVVYEARQVSLKRRVALKVLPPALGMSPQAKQRFEREAQAAAKLHHTNIVPVHAIGQHEGHHFYAMDLIEGQSLDRVLRDVANQGTNNLLAETVSAKKTSTESTPVTTGRSSGATSTIGDTCAGSRAWFDAVAKLIAEVADGLDYAHSRGVIHRDIKPANLMLSGEGRLCITDFGLARIVQEPGMTVSGSFLGTPAYMSPEQIAAGRVKLDHRTDVYSLGAVLYELLTLRRAFDGESREEVLGAIMTKDPRSPRKLDARVPPDLDTICLKALEKDPDRRYATAGEFAQDLRQYVHGGLITARRAGPLRRARKAIGRHPLVFLAALAIVGLVILGGIAWRERISKRAAEMDRLVSEARLLMTRGEMQESLDKVERALGLLPDHAEARLVRARVYLHRYQNWDAVREAELVLQQEPDNWEAHLVIAAAARKTPLRSVPVDEHLAAVKGLVPNTADAHFLRGAGQAQHEDKRERLRWLDAAIRLDPGHAPALEARSDVYLGLGDLSAALADAERLITALPRGARGYVQAAYVYHSLHHEARALQAIAHGLELVPGDAQLYLERSRVHAQRRRTSERIADLDRAIELNPRVEVSWHERAHAFRDRGEYDLAVANYRKAIELNPDLLESYREIFWAHWNAGRREEAGAALGDLEARVRTWLDSRSADGHQELALMYAKIGDGDRASEEAQRGVELRPDWYKSFFIRAQVRSALSQESGVEEDCERMARIELEEPREFLQRGNAMRDLCRHVEHALADYRKAIETAPSWADPHYERALLYEAEDDLELAVAAMKKAVELAPGWTQAQVALTRLRGFNEER